MDFLKLRFITLGAMVVSILLSVWLVYVYNNENYKAFLILHGSVAFVAWCMTWVDSDFDVGHSKIAEKEY